MCVRYSKHISPLAATGTCMHMHGSSCYRAQAQSTGQRARTRACDMVETGMHCRQTLPWQSSLEKSTRRHTLGVVQPEYRQTCVHHSRHATTTDTQHSVVTVLADLVMGCAHTNSVGRFRDGVGAVRLMGSIRCCAECMRRK
jgi:hypothetical protein